MSFSSMHNDYLDPDRHLWENESHREDMVCKVAEWCCISWQDYTELEDIERAIAKAIYKGTDSGAWIQFDEDSVKFAGYVEGWDGELPPVELHWPFTEQVFWDSMEETDSEACNMWDMVHEGIEE